MSQAQTSILINLPPHSSTPGTPDMPGTPTSTTTSLSALSTIAIKDGHRGHLPPSGRHAHNPSTTSSLEAERADRISRLAGLERVSASLRASSSPASVSGAGAGVGAAGANSSYFGNPAGVSGTYAFQQGHWLGAQGGALPPPQQLTPAYFDARGQPTAITKISTVGTASATTRDEYADSSSFYQGDDDTSATARTNPEGEGEGEDYRDRDEDMLSMENNYVPHLPGEVSSLMSQDGDDRGSYAGGDGDLSDDTASLVGFGEGAGSTISGPIYHRRPLPGVVGNSSAAAVGAPGSANPGGEQRLPPGDIPSSPLRPETPRSSTHLSAGGGGSGGGETPVSASALQERRAARMTNGVAVEGVGASAAAGDEFVDTTAREPIVLQGEAPRTPGKPS